MPNVLLIDDCRPTVESFAGILRLNGFTTATADTGHRGIAIASADSFDVILVDLRLPDISGIEVVRQLKGLGISSPVVIITAFPDIESTFDAASVGAAGYIDAPLFGDEIGDVVQQALRGQFPVRHPARKSLPQPNMAPNSDSAFLATDPRVKRVVHLVDSCPQGDWSVKTLAARLRLSESRLRHLFAGMMGVPLSRFIADRRQQMAAQLLATTSDTFKDIVRRVGLSQDLRRAHRAFRARFGMSPKTYRDRFRRRNNPGCTS
jgi:two-component system, response regulator YesN